MAGGAGEKILPGSKRKRVDIMDIAKERFAWLLNQRGFRFEDEANLDKHIEVKNTRPDFLVSPTGSCRFFAEVEGFEKPGPLRRATARVYSAPADQMLPRLRTAVRHGSIQLKPYRHLNIPMIVVLDNHRRVGISLGKTDLINLLGTQEICQPINVDTGDPVGSPYFQGSDQSFHVLSPQHNRHVSAVAVNLPKEGHQHIKPVDLERPMRVLVLYNPYADVPFPIGIFNDLEDEHICFVDGRWIESKGCKR